MKKNYELVIVIPVGPNASVEFTADTINSIEHYVSSTYKIIVIDDSQKGLGAKIKELFPHTDLLETPQNNGRLCGLYITLCIAYKHALQNYSFSLVFKVDTDALIINNNPEKEALRLFKNKPAVGMAGQYPLNYDGTRWDISWPKQRMLEDLCSWRIIKNFFANVKLRKWYKKALSRNYKTGESVFGGSYFISEPCLKMLDKKGLLPLHRFKTINLEEDHLLSLLVKANGFELGDLSSGNLPLACAWLMLPASPEQLYNEGKKVIHSTRRYNEMDEAEIRSFFKNKRQQFSTLEKHETILYSDNSDAGEA